MMACTYGAMSFGFDGIRHKPHEAVEIGASTLGGHLTSLETLLDGVLMRAGERSEHEVAGVRVTLGNLDLVAVLNRLANLGHVGQVKLRVDALGELAEAQRPSRCCRYA